MHRDSSPLNYPTGDGKKNSPIKSPPPHKEINDLRRENSVECWKSELEMELASKFEERKLGKGGIEREKGEKGLKEGVKMD